MYFVPVRGSLRWRSVMIGLLAFAMLLCSSRTVKAQNEVMGELEFEGKTRVEQSAGVWVDGNYVGYLKELKGKKKIMLLPGQHEVVVRQSGYVDSVQKILVQPGEKKLVIVTLQLAPHAIVPN